MPLQVIFTYLEPALVTPEKKLKRTIVTKLLWAVRFGRPGFCRYKKEESLTNRICIEEGGDPGAGYTHRVTWKAVVCDTLPGTSRLLNKIRS